MKPGQLIYRPEGGDQFDLTTATATGLAGLSDMDLAILSTKIQVVSRRVTAAQTLQADDRAGSTRPAPTPVEDESEAAVRSRIDGNDDDDPFLVGNE